jgi:hypothetical protein
MSIAELYRTWKEKIRTLRPGQRMTQVQNFAWMMVGIYQNRSVHLSKIAGKILSPAKLLSVRAQDIANSFEHSSYFVEGSGHR